MYYSKAMKNKLGSSGVTLTAYQYLYTKVHTGTQMDRTIPLLLYQRTGVTLTVLYMYADKS